ncbi:MAG: hypothetical protein RB191_15475 [Terriglobia bacterium]|nr:hypothetical protein [Terriglobia bacterium]
MTLIGIIGAVGSLLFGAACAPMAWKTLKSGHGIGTPEWTIWIFVAATLLFGVYMVDKVGAWQVPTLVIFFEAVCWLIALWYEYFPRGGVGPEQDMWESFFPRNRKIPTLEYCTRPHHGEGPCNGFPRKDCPMTDAAREMFGYPTPVEDSLLEKLDCLVKGDTIRRKDIRITD